MPTDVERHFASLAADAGRARLAPSADIRRRADRRVLTRSVAGGAATVILVLGVTVGARAVLGDPDRPPAVPMVPVSPGPNPLTSADPTPPAKTVGPVLPDPPLPSGSRLPEPPHKAVPGRTSTEAPPIGTLSPPPLPWG